MSDTQLCKCSNLGTMSLRIDVLTGHHQSCLRCPSIWSATEALLTDLCSGIEAWAAEEDGIYPELWEAYRKAKFIATGKILKEPDHE